VRVLKHVNFNGGRILDSGCGFGTVMIEVARAFPEVDITGIDLSEPLLELGNELIKEAGLEHKINLRKDDVHQLKDVDNHYDLVINSYMLHLVEDPVTMLNEIERVTKPEGKILITDLRRIWLGLFYKKLKTTLTLDEAMAIIEKSVIRKGCPKKGPFWWDYFCL